VVPSAFSRLAYPRGGQARESPAVQRVALGKVGIYKLFCLMKTAIALLALMIAAAAPAAADSTLAMRLFPRRNTTIPTKAS
jgi:hypothetical protein